MTHSRPEIFISATSSDLETCRQLIKEAMRTLGCIPVEQTNFAPEAGLVREMLRKRIAACHAVIHVAGEIYGAEPQQRSEGEPRRSYTQMEYDIARELGKPVYVFVCGEGFPYDEHSPEDDEKQALQQAHRNRLIADDHLFNPVKTRDELALRVHALQIQVEQFQKVLQQSRNRYKYAVIAGAIAILLIGGIVYHSITKIEQTSKKIEETEKNILDAVHDNRNVDTNLYKNTEYLDLKQKVEEIRADVEQERKHIEKYPDDDSFRASLIRKQDKLAKYEKNLEDFKRKVLELAEEINRIPINSERGKKARAFFEQGNYQTARDALNEKEMGDEMQALLRSREQRKKQEEEAKARENDLATDYMLKARLTAFDYQLGDQRIAQTRQFFEDALVLDRTHERLFDYARFMQENNQFSDAEKLYQEALSIRRELAKINPNMYQPYVAATLNNLGLLVAADSSRRREAENIYKEALSICRELAKNNPAVYQSGVAMVLNNLGLLFAVDSSRRHEAEEIYKEALVIRRELAKNNPAVYLPDVAGTLNNLGLLIAADSSRRREAEERYQEALKSYRELAKSNPVVYLPDVAMVLNNLGLLVTADSNRQSEAEVLLQEALAIARDRAKQSLPYILDSLGLVYLNQQQSKKALPYLQEAVELFSQLAEQAPSVYGEYLESARKLLQQAMDDK